jgi:hypothetical protein
LFLPVPLGRGSCYYNNYGLALAYGMGTSVGYAVAHMPGLLVGVAPQIQFNIIHKSVDSSQWYDFMEEPIAGLPARLDGAEHGRTVQERPRASA